MYPSPSSNWYVQSSPNAVASTTCLWVTPPFQTLMTSNLTVVRSPNPSDAAFGRSIDTTQPAKTTSFLARLSQGDPLSPHEHP